MKLIVLLVLFFTVFGCALTESGYKTFYEPYLSINDIPHAEPIEDVNDIKIFGTDDFNRDVRILRSKRYIPLGHSSFNGPYEDQENILEHAKNVGATVVLVNSEYTNTLTTSGTLFMPNTQTTYHSGTVNTGTSTGIYTGTSTTYGTTAIPYTSSVQRFDQNAVFLVKSNQPFKFGIFLVDLTPEIRASLERNTGALIDIVVEDTPAFYANLLPGDIIIELENKKIFNSLQALEAMAQYDESLGSASLTIIRNNREKNIQIEF